MGGELFFSGVPLEQENIGVVLVGVASADAEDASIGGDRYSVGQWPWQVSCIAPRAREGFENEGAVVPDFCSSLPWRLVGKVGTTSDDKDILVSACERSSEADGVGDRRERVPIFRRLRICHEWQTGEEAEQSR